MSKGKEVISKKKEEEEIPYNNIWAFLKGIEPPSYIKWLFGIVFGFFMIAIPFYCNTNQTLQANTEKIDTNTVHIANHERRLIILEKNPELNPELKKYLDNIMAAQNEEKERQVRIEGRLDKSDERDDRIYDMVTKVVTHQK